MKFAILMLNFKRTFITHPQNVCYYYWTTH